MLSRLAVQYRMVDWTSTSVRKILINNNNNNNYYYRYNFRSELLKFFFDDTAKTRFL